MAGIETSIWLALKSRVVSLPLVYERAWPGQTFTPPSAGGKLQPFLSIGRVSSAPVGMFIDAGKPHERRGSLIITLVYPLGQDIAVYDELGAKIAAYFKDGVEMRYADICASVRGYPHVQEGYEETGYWHVPVVIPWKCYA